MSQSAGLSAEDLRTFLDEERLIGRLSTLVRTPSENPPGEEAAAAAVVRAFCDELRLETEVHSLEANRPSVIARWRGSNGKTIGYCSHIDVVPAGDASLWEFDPFGAVVDEGRLHGRGASDAKGPVAAALEAISILKDAGFQPTATLELALVADEESGGFKGAGFLVQEGLTRPDLVVVGEPTSLRLVRAQRGIHWLRLTTHGRAGHGSAPERGINAIDHMLEVLTHLPGTLPDIRHEVVGGPTIGIGTIRGGVKVNVIPATCIAEIDRRTVPGESSEDVIAGIESAIAKARRRFPNIDCRIEVLGAGQPFEVAEDARLVTELTNCVSEVIGREPDLVGFRGASDARFFAETGVDVVVCGPGQIEIAHTAHESIDLEELRQGALVYALAFARLLSDGL